MPKSMINTCCNLYFYYNFIVHGGIRHLEMVQVFRPLYLDVHGGIRHLEINKQPIASISWFMAAYAI